MANQNQEEPPIQEQKIQFLSGQTFFLPQVVLIIALITQYSLVRLIFGPLELILMELPPLQSTIVIPYLFSSTTYRTAGQCKWQENNLDKWRLQNLISRRRDETLHCDFRLQRSPDESHADHNIRPQLQKLCEAPKRMPNKKRK